jgi:hypothetical protein
MLTHEELERAIDLWLRAKEDEPHHSVDDFARRMLQLGAECMREKIALEAEAQGSPEAGSAIREIRFELKPTPECKCSRLLDHEEDCPMWQEAI